MSGPLRYVDAVMVRVPDLESGIAFHRDVLGQDQVWRNDAFGQAGLAMPDSAVARGDPRWEVLLRAIQ
jgi:catechol 2,3-dioxygenase-like lactoylglutathione lyase family enzyme